MSDPDRQNLLNEIAELSQGLDDELPAFPTTENMIGQGNTPLAAPPAMSKNIHGEGVIQSGARRMEQLGYMWLDGLVPDQDKVNEILKAFDESQTIKEGPTTHIQGGPVCDEVLQSGVGEPIREIAQRVLGTEFVISQGPVILGHNPNATELDATELGHKFAHPRGEHGISFIRLVHRSMNTTVENATIAPDLETFVLYESSHSADHFDEKHAPFIRPAAAPHRLFVLRGALRCKIRPPEGCILVWVGFSTGPILEMKRRLDISFPFMVNYQRVQLPEPGTRNGRSKYRDYRKK